MINSTGVQSPAIYFSEKYDSSIQTQSIGYLPLSCTTQLATKRTMKAPASSFRSHYKAVMRAYRLAFKGDIMALDACAIRMQAITHVRDFTGQWEIPVPLKTSPWARRKTAYKPILAFRRHMKAN